MAENGWLLKKQGSSWERYERSTPQKLRYRIEYSQVKAIDGIQEMTDDQVEFYADCGWELVSERRRILDHPFFDYVVEGRYTMVAVKGNMVIGITCVSSDALREDWMTVLEVLAKKWD